MEPGSLIELIDFSSESPPTRLSYVERIAHAGIAISRCKVEPNPGTMLGATQFVVAIHEGDPIEMEWRPPEKEQIERCQIVAGDLHFNPADRPLFLRWTGSPRPLVIGMERRFIEQVVSDAFDGRELALRTAIGIRDSVIEGMAAAWRR